MGILSGQWVRTTATPIGISGITRIGWYTNSTTYQSQPLTLWEEFCQAVVQEYWNQQMSTITISCSGGANWYGTSTPWTGTSPYSYTKIYNTSGYAATFTNNFNYKVGTYYDEE